MDHDWKKNLGFPVNYSSQSSDDDFDTSDVVMRNPRHSSRYLLDDVGDGSEADLLGTTPPRSRIRDKEKRRNILDAQMNVRKTPKPKKPVDDSNEYDSPNLERLKRRSNLKLVRSRARDWKQDQSQRENRSDSLPSSDPSAAVPTLVESCNRFMSLTSRLKCIDVLKDEDLVEERVRDGDEELPANRINFHKTFCMLINMGNIEKGCRRTISREEQVWQNELKDLIWLELQAAIAGRTLAEQDDYLCSQRNIVPTLIQNIIDYRFVSSDICKYRSKPLCYEGSKEDLTSDPGHDQTDTHITITEPAEDGQIYGCLSFNCEPCTQAIGKAMREVGTLLDSFYNALSLYPSSKAMTAHHPLIATQLFKNRMKAMCLWYNVALHMHLKVASVRRMLGCMRAPAPPTHDSSRRSSDSQKPCQVRFNLSNNPTDSSNSDSSLHSDVIKEEAEGQEQPPEPITEEGSKSQGNEDQGEAPQGSDEHAEEHVESHGDSAEKTAPVSEDEIDRGIDWHSETSGQLTPEVVPPSAASSESGYASASDGGALAELARLRLLGRCDVSPYRMYHHEMLKTQSVRRCMSFMDKLRKHVLAKVYMTLEKPDHNPTENITDGEDGSAGVFDEGKEEEVKEQRSDREAMVNELRRYGCWSEECLSMRLPSYRNYFLLLSSICLEAVHDYLSMRLEGRPEKPSCLTIKQLIHELKEGLDIATEARADFVRNVRVALAGVEPEGARADLLLLVRTYDATVEDVMRQYLSYLTTMSETERLSRAQLQAEWDFSARLAKRVRHAARLAPPAHTNITCNQLERVLQQFRTKFANIKETMNNIDYKFESKTVNNSLREAVYALCRETQAIYASERDALLQALQAARALAARLARAAPARYRPQRERIFEKLMSIREFVVRHTDMVLDKSRIVDEDLVGEVHEGLIARAREMLLQMFKLGFELHRELHKFAQAPLMPVGAGLGAGPGERRPRPVSLQPPRRTAPRPPRAPRPGTMMLQDTSNFVLQDEVQFCGYRLSLLVLTPPLFALKLIHRELHQFANSPGGRARRRLARADSVAEDAETSIADDRLFDANAHENIIIHLFHIFYSERDRLFKINNYSYRTASSACSHVRSRWIMKRLLCRAMRVRGCGRRAAALGGAVARAIIQFAKCWMHFVVQRCDRGRGLRPRWASQGLDFLTLACDPYNTKHLSEDEFKELEALMDGCISHVVGSRAGARPPARPAPGPRPPRARRPPHRSPPTGSRGVPPPPTPPMEPDPLMNFRGQELAGHSARVSAALAALERARYEELVSRRLAGRVLPSAPSYEPKLRQLTFKWQRGLKIGAGTFGKVYTVVNTESGQLLAMKELNVGAGDRRALQRAANELRVLEGVVHPHLVRYYGCELHREEMLLFMELCVEGSLETLVAGAGALPEPTVRRYTRQLLSAVIQLHARNIAHRDIKSGNIFLTNEGHCLKLGDFGCAVKIRAHTTAPGELQGYVGTQAYMAPEVFMKSTGHGRAADIWSVGCVVTEMASGKRPFSESDNNHQIMFMVGMGGRPHVPDSLSAEGQEFCYACLTHDPDVRPKAEVLSLHHFLMIKSDDDCKCEPAYLI
ncbi:mitogen-activated protein kinase kinase kinase 4 [Aphomia sociella]